MKKLLVVFLLVPVQLCAMDPSSSSDDFERVGEARVVDEVFVDDDAPCGQEWLYVKHEEEIDDPVKRGPSTPIAADKPEVADLQLIKSVEEVAPVSHMPRTERSAVVRPDARVPLSVSGHAYALRPKRGKKDVDKSNEKLRKNQIERQKEERKRTKR